MSSKKDFCRGCLRKDMRKAFEEKIKNTKWEFVPLGKMIPLKTAVNIFNKEYNKNISNYFSRDFQRLREIYFSLFACKALDEIEKKEHFLFFPEEQNNNDVNLISLDEKKESGNIQYYDVKEYINNQDNINVFISNIIDKSKNKNYNLIVGIHKDGKIEIDTSLISKSVFFVSNISKDSDEIYKSNVKLISQGSFVFDEIIDLNNLIDPNSDIIIFHNKLNLKV